MLRLDVISTQDPLFCNDVATIVLSSGEQALVNFHNHSWTTKHLWMVKEVMHSHVSEELVPVYYGLLPSYVQIVHALLYGHSPRAASTPGPHIGEP